MKRPEGDRSIRHIIDLLRWNEFQARECGETAIAEDLYLVWVSLSDLAVEHDLLPYVEVKEMFP